MAERADRLRRLADRLQRQTPAAQVARQLGRLQQAQQRLADGARALIRRREATVGTIDARLAARHPRHAISLLDVRLTAAAERLSRATHQDVRRRREAVESLSVHLEAVSPQRIFERGFSVTRLQRSGQIVRSAGEVRAADVLVTRFADGEVESAASTPYKTG